jgi:hypothetical protein
MRALLILLLALTGPAFAQDSGNPAPVLQIDFPETEAIPGQPLSLRLTILVPSFMPKPPVWPSFEAPNLLVRLPTRSTNPTSQTVDGQTWAGITRHYRISPMVPGSFSIPPQQVLVTYAAPETQAPVQATLTTGVLTFAGTVPDGAEGLDPFIAATALDLSQEVTGEPGAMVPGDSVTRTVTVRIEGAPPMFLPALLAPAEIAGLAAYPDEPAVEEHDDRGEVSGSRTESVTYVAQAGGGGAAPPVSLDWYNISTGKVETASVEAVTFAIDGPPASSSAPRDWRMIAVAGAAALIGLCLTALALRAAIPACRSWLRRQRAARFASEGHAFRRLAQSIARRSIGEVYPALDDWAEKFGGPDPRKRHEVADALSRLGSAQFGRAPSDARAAWRDLGQAVREARHLKSSSAARWLGVLPPLNPGEVRAE